MKKTEGFPTLTTAAKEIREWQERGLIKVNWKGEGVFGRTVTITRGSMFIILSHNIETDTLSAPTESLSKDFQELLRSIAEDEGTDG